LVASIEAHQLCHRLESRKDSPDHIVECGSLVSVSRKPGRFSLCAAQDGGCELRRDRMCSAMPRSRTALTSSVTSVWRDSCSRPIPALSK
jgi:hypothetical protein